MILSKSNRILIVSHFVFSLANVHVKSSAKPNKTHTPELLKWTHMEANNMFKNVT